MTAGVPLAGVASDWLEVLRPVDAARLRLVLFPYAGGRPAAFRSWPLDLPADVEVVAVSYPGRGARLGEAPVRRADALAAQVAAALAPGLDVPTAFFGHSMGALVAFETARALRRGGLRQPVLLCPSGQAAPDLPVTDHPLHALPDDAFVAALSGMGGTPPEILASRELMTLLLPSLRADFELCERYRFAPEPLLDIPFVAFAGTHDAEAPESDVSRWEAHTTAPATLHRVAGGHFFLHDAEPVVCGMLAEALAA